MLIKKRLVTGEDSRTHTKKKYLISKSFCLRDKNKLNFGYNCPCATELKVIKNVIGVVKQQ
jgi:hypothetical protein